MKILHFILISSIVLLSLTINSCERGYHYSYNLFNNTDSIIYVNFKTGFNDTIIVVKPNETKEIFTTYHGLEGSRGPYKRDVKDDIYDISIKRGSKLSYNNYRKNELWTFEKKSDFKAVYEAVVTNAEF
jgi:hypothetical protein